MPSEELPRERQRENSLKSMLKEADGGMQNAAQDASTLSSVCTVLSFGFCKIGVKTLRCRTSILHIRAGLKNLILGFLIEN